jgi:hypothetical protein
MLLSMKGRAIETITALKLPAAEHEQIMSGTAKRLLKL